MKTDKPKGSARTTKESEAVEDRSTPPTPVIYEVVRRHGEEEMARPGVSLWWSGVAAGLSISFSMLAQAVIDLRTPAAQWAPLAIAAGYPVGFLMVVLGRQQLFTESTITMVLPAMARPTRANLVALARSWSIILAANLAGTLIAALFCSWTPVISPELREAMLELSRLAVDKAWAVLFFEAITAGFLMAAMVWLLPSSEGSPFAVIALMTYLIAISGSAHIVAGSIEAFLLLIDGRIGPWHAFAHFGVPVLLGNIVGGTALFAVISHAQVMREIYQVDALRAYFGARPLQPPMTDPSGSSAHRLDPPIQGGRDHCLGSDVADLTLVEYGSFDCPYCQGAHEVIANLRDRFGERLRYVFRHRPITGNARARAAAELAEYAHESAGEYWEAHDELMRIGPKLSDDDLEALSTTMELPGREDGGAAAWERAQAKVAEDMASAAASGAMVSPTFFINGRRYEGPWDENTLAEALNGSLGHRMQAAALDFARWAPSTGLLLLATTLVAVALANSPLGPAVEHFWEMPVSMALGATAWRLPLRELINDGLLTFFFLVVGLEIKRELTIGRLASRRAAALPIAAAAGGMLVPALLYLAVAPTGHAAGWAIPTTTDTAFAVALIALLGTRVPVELRIFLTAAVIVDDLVAIVIVALFYSGKLDIGYAVAAGGVAILLVLVNRNGIYRALPYAILGLVLWICLHRSGLHATLAGVILAMATPTRPPPNLNALVAQAESVIHAEQGRSGERVLKHGPSEPALRALDAIHDRIESPADKLLRSVEPWSSYLILPIFALANAGLALSPGMLDGQSRVALAVVLGLVVGKPLGMLAGAALALRAGIATKPEAYSWMQLAGAVSLAGIGFTMSLYIAGKAFADPAAFAAAKVGVFIASVLAGAIGVALLRRAGTTAS